MLFNGTIRKNLDPFDQHDDASLWRALQEVSHLTSRYAWSVCVCARVTSARRRQSVASAARGQSRHVCVSVLACDVIHIQGI